MHERPAPSDELVPGNRYPDPPTPAWPAPRDDEAPDRPGGRRGRREDEP